LEPIVADQIRYQARPYLFDDLELGLASLSAEVLVEQHAVQPLADAVGLRPADRGPLGFDAFEMEEQLIGKLILAAVGRRSARQDGAGASRRVRTAKDKAGTA
jgi:hypothetical protein